MANKHTLKRRRQRKRAKRPDRAARLKQYSDIDRLIVRNYLPMLKEQLENSMVLYNRLKADGSIQIYGKAIFPLATTTASKTDASRAIRCDQSIDR